MLVVSFLFTGITFTTSTAEIPGTIKLGIYLPMTGPMAPRGQIEYEGIRIANRIKPEIGGKNIELFLVDTMAEEIGSERAAATRLIKDNKVCAIIGELSGVDQFGGLSIAEKEKIPTVIPAYKADVATEGRRYAFRVGLTNSLHGEAAARYLYSNLYARKAAVLLTIDRDDSVELANSFAKNFTQMGGEVVAIAYCQNKDDTLNYQLSSIIAAKPDIIYLTNPYSQVAAACRQLREMGNNTPILSSNNVHVPEFVGIGGDNVEGVTFTDDFYKTSISTYIGTVYVEEYEKETGNSAARLDVLGADAYFLLLDAIERAQSTVGSNIMKALEETRDFRGISGIMNMDTNGNAVKNAVMLNVKDGEFQYRETQTLGEQQQVPLENN